MKGFFLLAFLVLFSANGNTQSELVWYEDLGKAAKVSQKTGKPLMLFFTGSDWCGWCIKLQNEVFKKPEFTEWAKENVVLVDLDFPRKKPQDSKIKEQNQKLQVKFGVRGYPTVIFASPTKNDLIEVGGRSGYIRGGASVWCMDATEKLKSK